MTISTPESSSNSCLSLDPKECLEGIRKAYYSCTSFGEDEGSDQETANQSTLVEEHLLSMLAKEDTSNQDSVFTKARQADLKRESATSALKLAALHSKHAFPCADTYKALPSDPSIWPQGTLMLRPTPNTSTKIRGIRRASSLEYQHFAGFCAGCILPVNNGSEAPGESLVIDFESTHFVGSLLMRIKQAKNHKAERSGQVEPTKYVDTSYFDGKKRRFQAVVKGRFKTPLPMSETVTGQSFDRPAGRLPARWIVTSFIKFVSRLAPQLEVELDGNKPRFLTPLVATAHTVRQCPLTPSNKKHPNVMMSTDMEEGVEEPSSLDESSVLGLGEEILGATKMSDTSKSSIGARMKARKKVYNSIAAKKESSLLFKTDREYTFEFYQHLLDFGDEGLAVDMGRPIGKVGLSQVTDGQPLKFMSAHRDPLVEGELDTLWSFDIWHASLFPYAEVAYQG